MHLIGHCWVSCHLEPEERNSLATLRFIGIFSRGIFVTSTAAYFINAFKDAGANETQGYQYTVTIYAIIAIILFFITYKWNKERVIPQKKKQSYLRDDLKKIY